MATIADLVELSETDLGIEIDRIADGEPNMVVPIAGLQFYDYLCRDELGVVRPSRGDRLSLVRQPRNPHDHNAVQVWWRNSRMLGHLPWYIAGRVASGMDAGEPLRAYVVDDGDGRPWSVTALLVGSLVQQLDDTA